jgi:hypothetical protein
LPIGFFIGVIFVAAQQMLILFVIYADRAGKSQKVVDKKTQAEQAMAVFSFFLFLIYGFFGLLLTVFRADILQEGSNIFETTIIIYAF